MGNVEIREAIAADQPGIDGLAITAFEASEGPIIVELIHNLLVDPTAKPLLSLVACLDEKIVGHILFTAVKLEPAQNISAAILCPLAVLPAHQKQGIGSQLIKIGLEQLKAQGIQLVFVLGYPSFYNRSGFAAAGVQGFEATYPIAPENSEAWMVQELQPNILGNVQGRVICADALDDEKYWVE